jgi:hypothetical protein
LQTGISRSQLAAVVEFPAMSTRSYLLLVGLVLLASVLAMEEPFLTTILMHYRCVAIPWYF